MRVILQRVSKCDLHIEKEIHSSIGKGLLVLVGITNDDLHGDIEWIVNKIINLRVFNDDKGVMNESTLEQGNALMIVSQFTLYASTKKGNRPSYIKASKPETAKPLYESFVKKCREKITCVRTGVFGADMKVDLVNEGPVTILIDSKNRE